MNIIAIREHLETMSAGSGSSGQLKSALAAILQQHLLLTHSDVDEFHRVISSIAEKSRDIVQTQFSESVLTEEEYYKAMTEQFLGFLSQITLTEKEFILAAASDQDLATLIHCSILDSIKNDNRVETTFEDITKEIVADIEPVFSRETQHRILSSLIDITTFEIPMNPVLFSSTSLSPSKPGSWLMMDAESMNRMLRRDEDARHDLETLEQQRMSLAFILDKTRSDSEPTSLDYLLDTLLLQIDTDLPSVVNEPSYHQHWSKLNRLDQALEKLVLKEHEDLSVALMELERIYYLLTSRQTYEREQNSLSRQIAAISTQEWTGYTQIIQERRLSDMLQANTALLQQLERMPSESDLNQSIQAIRSSVDNPDALLDAVMSSSGRLNSVDTYYNYFNVEQRRLLFKGIIDHLNSREWRLSAEHEGLLYSHYQKRFDEQSGLYNEQEKCLLVFDDRGQTRHKLQSNELKNPIDKTCFLHDARSCLEFRDLLVACSINGDVEGFRRRQYIREQLETGSYIPSDETAEHLEFFKDVDAFIAQLPPFYLIYIKENYRAFIHKELEQFSLTSGEWIAIHGFQMTRMGASSAFDEERKSNKSRFFKIIHNDLGLDDENHESKLDRTETIAITPNT